MRSSALVKIGIAAIVTGVVIFSFGLYVAPTTVAVNQAVSLSPGRIVVPEFEINNEQTYFIDLRYGDPAKARRPECDGYAYPTSIIRTHWILSQSQKTVAEGTGNNYWMGMFGSEPGRYQLTVDVLSDTSCLNPAHPRLVVTCGADPDPLGTSFWAGMLILFGVGIMLPVRSLSRPVALTKEIAVSPEAGREVLSHRRSLPLLPRMSFLPSIGLFASIMVGTLAMGMLLLLAIEYSQRIRKGLYVFESPALYTNAVANPAVSPIVVNVEVNGHSVRYLLDNEEVAPSDLRAQLREKLSQRPEWVVFIEGDRELPFEVFARVVDVANGLGAKSVLLTPQMKGSTTQEIKQDASRLAK